MNKIVHYKSYDLKSMRKPDMIAVTHENDVDTQVVELHLLNGWNPVALSASYTYTASMVNRDTQALIDDSVTCTLNESGNVEIPIDNLHTQGGMTLLIELTITDSDGNQILVTPFPLTVHVNPSILDDAQVTPNSLGTIPELLEEAKEALEDISNIVTAAAVNQNGTITITLSDGTTVTSTGAVIESTSNKVTTIDANSTNAEYPSAKAVYDAIQNISPPKTDISSAVVTLSASSFTYDGTSKAPSVTSVALNGTTLTEWTDYIVIAASATNAGSYALTVNGIGDYTGTVIANWSIAKAQAVISGDSTITISENDSPVSKTYTSDSDSR